MDGSLDDPTPAPSYVIEATPSVRRHHRCGALRPTRITATSAANWPANGLTAPLWRWLNRLAERSRHSTNGQYRLHLRHLALRFCNAVICQRTATMVGRALWAPTCVKLQMVMVAMARPFLDRRHLPKHRTRMAFNARTKPR
jgi:hypothetical protein